MLKLTLIPDMSVADGPALGGPGNPSTEVRRYNVIGLPPGETAKIYKQRNGRWAISRSRGACGSDYAMAEDARDWLAVQF